MLTLPVETLFLLCYLQQNMPTVTKQTMAWKKLVTPANEIDLSTVLRSGQAFRWRNLNGVWSCALNNQIILLRECLDEKLSQQVIEYRSIQSSDAKLKETTDLSKFIHRYFNLDISISDLHKHWCKVDLHFPAFKESAANVKMEEGGIPTPPESGRDTPVENGSLSPVGVRIMSQDPWETLISFIISSNNNIKRISQLCEVLCITYGNYVGTYEGVPYFTFPTPREFFGSKNHNDEISTPQLSKLESQLRSLGFGYRAKYITKTVNAMIEKPELLEILMNPEKSLNDDVSCVEFLRQFDGVGPKVADCVALMGCKRHDLVPVDTHVWNILRNRYRTEFNKWVDLLGDESNAKYPKTSLKKALSNKAVDIKIYPFVKQFFKDYWERNSGWAQAVVFATVVKLDNGINSVEDVEKLISKVNNSLETEDTFGSRAKRQKRE